MGNERQGSLFGPLFRTASAFSNYGETGRAVGANAGYMLGGKAGNAPGGADVPEPDRAARERRETKRRKEDAPRPRRGCRQFPVSRPSSGTL